jgi:putative ABC transport system ATP-binding protein
MFQVKNLNLIYDVDKEEKVCAVNDVTLTLPDKGLIGIIGPSGSGKSSLMYCLSTLKTPTDGCIVYNGTDYRDMGRGELERLRREQFGFVFQHHFLIGYMNVMDNVMVAAKETTAETRERAKELLMGLRIKETEFKKKPKQLSGGQRQRCAIARALINTPKVLFADEPTASLDHENAFRVMQYLKEYANEHLVLVITHDHSILEGADRVIEIWDGAISTKEAL